MPQWVRALIGLQSDGYFGCGAGLRCLPPNADLEKAMRFDAGLRSVT
jgi:hypothetical protein